MRSRTLVIVVVAASVSVLGLAMGLAAAHATRTVRVGSHITIKSNSLTFSGNVTSSKAPCKMDREVTLYRTPFLLLGSATTSSSGHWKLTVSGSAGITLGHFYARVAKRSEGAAGTIYVCNRARSKTIHYRP
jgi:hypothetical protein